MSDSKQQPSSQSNGTKKQRPRWARILVALAIFVVGSALFALLILRAGGEGSPRHSLAMAWEATKAHNASAFEKYVNTNSVAESLVSHVIEAQEEETASSSGLDKLKGAFNGGVLHLLKPELVTSLEAQLTSFVRTGTFQPATADEKTGTLMRRIWHATGDRPQDFRGFGPTKEISETEAIVPLVFFRDQLGVGYTLNVKMVNKNGYWQAVSLPDFDTFLADLEEVRTAHIALKNKPTRAAITKALRFTRMEKVKTDTDMGIGKGVTFRLGYENTADRAIDAFHADLMVRDIDGELIRSFVIHDRDTLLPGNAAEKTWTLNINPLSESANTLYETPSDELQIGVVPYHLIFADGEELKIMGREE